MTAIIAVSAACGGASLQDRSQANDGLVPGAAHPAVLMATQPVLFVPGYIDYTGATDVTQALQRFIDHVPNGRLLRFHKNGKYRVNGTIVVTNKTTLTFDGQNATIFATTPGKLERSQWWITGGGGIIFRNMIVRGANPHGGLSDEAYVPKREKQHGFRIEGVNGIELDHVTVTDVYGDFVYVARDLELVPCTNVWVHDSTFRRNGRQGVALVAVTGAVIERNDFAYTRRGTIDLEPNGPNQTVSNAFILNNTVGAGRLLFIASHGKGPVVNIVISGNKLKGHEMTIDVVPLKDQRRRNWVITNNTSNAIARHRPIRLIDVDGVLVKGNTQKVQGGAPAVQLVNVCGGRVETNSFGGAGVLRQGPSCTAQLVVPPKPNIPGRP